MGMRTKYIFPISQASSLITSYRVFADVPFIPSRAFVTYPFQRGWPLYSSFQRVNSWLCWFSLLFVFPFHSFLVLPLFPSFYFTWAEFALLFLASWCTENGVPSVAPCGLRHSTSTEHVKSFLRAPSPWDPLPSWMSRPALGPLLSLLSLFWDRSLIWL